MDLIGQGLILITISRLTSLHYWSQGEAVSSILVNLMVSPQHVEVNLSEIKGYEKHVIVELIKEKSQIVSSTDLNCNQENCKGIHKHFKILRYYLLSGYRHLMQRQPMQLLFYMMRTSYLLMPFHISSGWWRSSKGVTRYSSAAKMPKSSSI